MSANFSLGEFTFDAAAKKLEGVVKGRDQEGKDVTWRQVDVWKDDNTRQWTMYQTKDGQESVAIEITYKRKR
jgi:hypothetical protein